MTRDLLVGVDIGGTFTDAAVVDAEGRVAVGKVPSTPDDFSEGFFGAVGDAAGTLGLTIEELLGRTRRLGHGTTVGINALVTRTGARVGLLATASTVLRSVSALENVYDISTVTPWLRRLSSEACSEL